MEFGSKTSPQKPYFKNEMKRKDKENLFRKNCPELKHRPTKQLINLAQIKPRPQPDQNIYRRPATVSFAW